MYYIDGEEGWIRVSKEGARYMATDELIENTKNAGTIKINYRNIVIGAIE